MPDSENFNAFPNSVNGDVGRSEYDQFPGCRHPALSADKGMESQPGNTLEDVPNGALRRGRIVPRDLSTIRPYGIV